MFVIPTNRPVLQAARSAVQEMLVMQRAGRDPEELLVLDNAQPGVSRRNREDLQELQRTSPFPIHHVDLEEQRQWVRQLAVSSLRDTDLLMNLLYPYPEEGDYGKVFNMTALYAVKYGRYVIHRRDSDTTTAGLDESRYPVQGELMYLGRKVSEIDSGMNSVEQPSGGLREQEILIAGSDYTGDWNVDLAGLQEKNSQALPSFLKALSIPEDSVPDYIRAKYPLGQEDQDRPSSGVLLITCEGRPALPEITPFYPECGNMAMKDIFQWIPSFIGSRCIGFDYHTYILGAMLHAPCVYHPNKIVHAHSPGRRVLSEMLQYWKGIAKLADYNHLISVFGRDYLHLVRLPGRTGFFAHMEAGTPAQLAEVLSRCHRSRDRASRLQVLHELVSGVLQPSPLEEYRLIAKELIRSQDLLIEELDRDYRRSFLLQSMWRELVESARQLRYVQL
ncbi:MULTISPECIES: DUF6271 family protein [Paenibacillus]|uniref:DUF6271 family protein n=1 Tax=Paenibacillus TaxID=44249 RepID=UPI0022B89F47|nr:DUF6271 family protein [Paenibacillus caseinilyticus]MCZ8521937.1 DUF6271 family protein [Paenibacillus caseinilyticus]